MLKFVCEYTVSASYVYIYSESEHARERERWRRQRLQRPVVIVLCGVCARAGGGEVGGASGLLAVYSQEVATKTGRINDNIFTGYLGRWVGSNHGT